MRLIAEVTIEPDPTPVLLAERERVVLLLAELRRDFTGILEASEGANADDEHDPEGSTIAFERSQIETLVRQAERRLAGVAAALGRVQDGSYGRCLSCGRPIGEARLEAKPATSTCIRCAT